MQLQLPEPPKKYKSHGQRARVSTEPWAEANLYCPNCASSRLVSSKAGTPVIDFFCPKCDSPFQLKSQQRPFSLRITDAGYAVMCRAITEDRTPNLFALHYDLEKWRIQNLILIPRFAFSLSAIEKRKPLGPKARRAGWVGCNILLSGIPSDAKIPVIANGVPAKPATVRQHYDRLRPLSKLNVEKRGWTLDVMNIVQGLGKTEFSLADMYAHEVTLARMHPANRHVCDKIRQQLQVLRDLGFVSFLGHGGYRLT